MSKLYNAALRAANSLVRMKARRLDDTDKRKIARFMRGQLGVFQRIEETVAKRPADGKKVLWIHSASLGEAAISHPIISEMLSRGDYRVVRTFFSPSGYEPLEPTHTPDHEVYYLPLDTLQNARRFLDLVRPDLAMFMVSEYWYNYLHELKRRSVPTFLVSAKIGEKSIFNRWYGFLHRSCLSCYRRIFVLDRESEDRLSRLGCTNVRVSGNPLFDNAIVKSRMDWSDPRIEKFIGAEKDVFIAGSVHDDIDISMITELANCHRRTRFIIVPHSIKEETISKICGSLKATAVRLSQADDRSLRKAQSLIIDNIGSLAYIYRYARYGYIGGGFTPFLHSLIEATVYGLPVAFGPRIERKVTPQQLVNLGLGCVVANVDELDAWFTRISEDERYLADCRRKAAIYMEQNANATTSIVDQMLES